MASKIVNTVTLRPWVSDEQFSFFGLGVGTGLVLGSSFAPAPTGPFVQVGLGLVMALVSASLWYVQNKRGDGDGE